MLKPEAKAETKKREATRLKAKRTIPSLLNNQRKENIKKRRALNI